MSKRTCHGCPNLELNRMRTMTIAYCGATEDGFIVPHEWNGFDNTITFTRVPDFCTNATKTKSEKPAPRSEWVKEDL